MAKLASSIGIAIVAAFLAGPIRAQQTVTMDQVGSDDAALRDQFWGVFEPDPHRSWRSRTRSPGDTVSLQTRPYPTEFPSMCRRDRVALLFAPAQDGVREPGDVTPMRAYSIDNTVYYHVYRAPEPGAPDFDDPWPGGVWNGPCSHLAPSARWFKAPDVETAFEGYRAMLSARSAVASRRVRLGRCRPPSGEDQTLCRDLFSDTEPRAPDSIRRCDARSHTACFLVEVADWIHIRIVVTQDFEGHRENTVMRVLDSRVAGRVLSVDVDFDHRPPLPGLD